MNRTKLYSVKPDDLRLTKTILELEKFNNINKDIFKPRAYKTKKTLGERIATASNTLFTPGSSNVVNNNKDQG